MKRCVHFSRTVRAALVAAGLALWPPDARAQTAPTSTFVVLFGSTLIGSEQVAVQRTPEGWTLTSSGRMGRPVDLVLRSFTAKYDADWKPREFFIDSTVRDKSATTRTIIAGATATSETTVLNALPVQRTDQIDPGALLVPPSVVGAFEAVAARLRAATPGETVALYQPAQGSLPLEVGESTAEQIKTVDRLITARRTRVNFRAANLPPLAAEVWGDENGRLLRVSIPAQNVEYAREDIASVSARLVTSARPNDEDLRIPANGFSLAATLSRPTNATDRLPAIVLVGGTDHANRDEARYDVAIFGQLANALADAGFIVLRYDQRGSGQSGGRVEAARLADFAEDAKAAIKTLSERKDVDRKRIAAVGHGEGGWIAMLASAKNNRVAALALIATGAVTGSELNLYQVRHGVERAGRPEAEREATIDLQRKIQEAVVSGTGWEAISIPENVRRQADTPYFQSFLTLDPAKVLNDVRQPLLIVQGERDMQVPPTNGEQLHQLAKKRKRGGPSELVTVPGVNHLLVPALTGELDEYATLTDRRISPGVSAAIGQWLSRTLTSTR